MNKHIAHASIFVVLCIAAAANAQTDCIPLAMGPPGVLFNRAPNWWDPSIGEPLYNNNIDAPGWRGAFGVGHVLGSATTEEAHFRALHRADSGGKEFIYLSWWGKVVPDLTTLGNNKLLVGFSNGGAGDPAFAFNIAVNVTSPKIATQDYTPLISVDTGGGWGPYTGVPAVPTWLKGTAVPATDGTTRIWLINSPNNQWAVHMRIPVSTIATPTNINDGVPINPASFKMWYEFRVGSMIAPNGFGFIPYKYPRTIADADPLTDAPPPVSAWATFHLNSSDSVADPGCSMNGVGIKASDIGTQNTDPNSISLLNPNTFFASPFNHSLTDPANNIRARFRIANWGNGASWEDVPNPNTNLWVDIGPATGVPLAGVNIAANSGTTITLPYDVSGPTAECERCKYESYYAANSASCNMNCGGAPGPGTDNNTKLDHQCLLVELTGTGVTFLNDSVYTNMNFVNASTFTEPAEVNLNGLSETAPGSLARDVYFYLEKFNMPEVGQDDDGDGEQDPTKPGASRAMVSKSPFDVNRPKDERRKELLELVRSGQLSYEELAKHVPTMIVRAYYDSGIRNTASGPSRPVLRPLQSFGYFVLHDGEPEGWITELKGTVKLAPRWYRLSVPASGVARIYPMIETVGGPPEPSSSSRRRFFLDIGPNFPGSGFPNFIDGRWSGNAGIEWMLRPDLSIEAIAGHHSFDGEAEGRFHFCLNIEQLGVNAKYYFYNAGPLHWFVNGGASVYYLDPPEDWKGGVNAGAGVLYDINSLWGIEGAYNYHRVSASPDDLNWSTVQAGLRIRF